MKFARVINGTVQETFVEPDGFELKDCFHPDVAAQFEPCGDEVEQGWLKDSNGFSEPPPQPEPDTTWSVDEVRDGLTLKERVKWDNDTAPEIVTAKQELRIKRNRADLSDILYLLIEAGIVSQDSVDGILNSK